MTESRVSFGSIQEAEPLLQTAVSYYLLPFAIEYPVTILDTDFLNDSNKVERNVRSSKFYRGPIEDISLTHSDEQATYGKVQFDVRPRMRNGDSLSEDELKDVLKDWLVSVFDRSLNPLGKLSMKYCFADDEAATIIK